MANRAVHATIRGRVQGVGYRAWCADRAEANGLSGWVRNRRSGEVEAVFCGEEAAVDAMLAELRQGPPAAEVGGVETEEAEAPEAGFRTLATA